jgi:2,4-dienoyl-CoA reductase (NADPH2)
VPRRLEDGGVPAREATWADVGGPGRVVVAGGGSTGAEAAIRAAEAGATVTIVEQGAELMPGEVFTDRSTFGERLEALGVEVLCSTRVERAGGDGVVLGDGRTLAADRVLVAVGAEPERALADDLAALDVPFVVVGDALRSGRVHDAVHTAHRAALNL